VTTSVGHLCLLAACTLVPTFAGAGLTSPASQGVPLSRSKLSVHLLGHYTEGGKRVVAVGPRVIKVLDPQANADMLAAMRDYKRRFPTGLVVVRVWEKTPSVHYGLADDPVTSADDFWRKILEPALNRLTPEDRALIDFLEGPNEGETTPTWHSVETATWFGRFWQRLAATIAQTGLRPCVGRVSRWATRRDHPTRSGQNSKRLCPPSRPRRS